MSEIYRTEEEQIEQLKKWWKENGKSTVVAIVVGIAAVFGWQGYQKQHQAKIESASAVYMNMLTAASGANGQPTAEQIATANHLADSLKQDYPSSTYAQFAALYKARFAVESNHLDQATEELQWVLANASLPEILIQTRLRLARVLYAQQKYDEALSQLNGETAAYSASYEEVKGDIYQAQGKQDLALAAYQRAVDLNAQAKSRVTNRLLEIKLEQLKSAMGQQPNEEA